MACIPNLNTVLSLDFSAVNDAPNWVTNSLNPVQTIGGQLVLNPSSLLSTFTRTIGIVDPTNNRIRIRANFQLDGAFLGPGNAEVVFEILEGTTVLKTSCAEFETVSENLINFFLDRTYDFLTMPAGSLTLRITFPVGFQYRALFDDLLIEDFNLCQDAIRTYFIIPDFFQPALTAVSAAVQLLSFKTGGVETLTPAFFAENITIGGNPLADWLYAQAAVDGQNRLSDDITPNSFNPFFNDWGMDFANVAGNYFGGKTLGPISGSNYGPSILGLGIDKPVILDGSLADQPGAFFIDLDLEQDQEIIFNAIINNNSTNPLSGPEYYRQYKFNWNADFCEYTYTYQDLILMDGIDVDVSNFAFLGGLTGPRIIIPVVPCGTVFSSPVSMGNYLFEVDLGSGTDTAGIDYNAYGVPKRFIVNYDGVDYDTGYVGDSAYDAQLLAAGVAPGDINTTPAPGNGQGTLLFPKPLAAPDFALVTVEAPIINANWQVTPLCPFVPVPNTPPSVTFSLLIAGEAGRQSNFSIVASDAEGPIANWQIDWNDGSPLEVGSGPPPTSITHVYATAGSYNPVITVFDGGSPQLSDNDNAPVTIGGPVFEELFLDEDNCYSCLGFRMVVPAGTSYDVVVVSNFNAPAVYATGFCDPGGGSIGIAIDGTTNYGPGTYDFHTGIDAAQTGPNTLLSQIIIRIREGATTLNLYTLNRAHDNAIC